MKLLTFVALLTGVAVHPACGDDEPAAAGGSPGGGGAGGDGPALVEGCDGARLLEPESDTSVRGPWPVGARTLSIDGLTVEAWYPAREPGGAATVYDVRDYLPASELGKIPDAAAPLQPCECSRDAPVDASRGPYPVIVFVHGTAGFRTQSLELTSHWASRGFVVLAADHPGLYLKDLLGSVCGAGNVSQDLGGDLAAIVAAVRSGTGLGDLAGVLDASRIGMAGHSAGGGAIRAQGEIAQVLVPMASGGAEAGAALRNVLVLGALEDQVVDYDQQVAGFDASPAPKRLVGFSPAGHLAFSSLCAIQNDAGQDIVEIGQAYGVCGLSLAGALFDCDPSYMPADVGWRIINEATSAAFEETLHCNAERAAWLAGVAGRHAEVAEYRDEGP